MTTMHTAQVAGVCVEDGTVTLTVSPLEVAPAKFAGDVMGWSVVRVGAEALPQEAEAGTPHPPAERLRKQRESSVARPPQRPPTALEPYWRKWVDELPIELTYEGTLDELRQAAYEKNCELRAERNEQTDELAYIPPPILARWMISHVRHLHSNYQRAVRNKPAAVGLALREKFDRAIAERYELASEEPCGQARDEKADYANAGGGGGAAADVGRAGRGVSIASVEAEVVMSVEKAEQVRREAVNQQGKLKANHGRPMLRHHGEDGASVVLHTSRGERYLIAAE